ncbi:uncharacterized protein LOC135079542 [Ostrinia nubilalis]|uniref:uncharacterized protein LOC135079542 n=1 Tax=Ostrinia nubilalis TaxID=29057 RepID=UPI003082314A
MFCAGCKGKLDVGKDSLKCNACESYYCLECLNLGAGKKVSDLGSEQLSALRCPSCTNVSRRRRGNESPGILSPSISKHSPTARNVLTIESISELLDQKLAPTSDAMKNSRSILIKEVKGLITAEMGKMVNELKEEFTKTTDFIMEEVKSLKSTIAQKDTVIKSLQSEQTVLKDELHKIRSRVSVMEKLSRDRNVELQAVPENRNENVVSMVKSLCEAIELPISDSDIHACRRVAKMDTTSKRPRNIVVTLTSPRLRDSLISAVHRYNKEHSDKKLNTNHIGIKDVCHQVYVSEHLSPECKQLYAAARRLAKDKGYTYCWVKYGQIYLRKSDEAGAILVKSIDFLNTLK